MMASLTKDRRILFKATDGKRKTLRVGQSSRRERDVLTHRLCGRVKHRPDFSALILAQPGGRFSRWRSFIWR